MDPAAPRYARITIAKSIQKRTQRVWKFIKQGPSLCSVGRVAEPWPIRKQRVRSCVTVVAELWSLSRNVYDNQCSHIIFPTVCADAWYLHIQMGGLTTKLWERCHGGRGIHTEPPLRSFFSGVTERSGKREWRFDDESCLWGVQLLYASVPNQCSEH